MGRTDSANLRYRLVSSTIFIELVTRSVSPQANYFWVVSHLAHFVVVKTNRFLGINVSTCCPSQNEWSYTDFKKSTGRARFVMLFRGLAKHLGSLN